MAKSDRACKTKVSLEVNVNNLLRLEFARSMHLPSPRRKPCDLPTGLYRKHDHLEDFARIPSICGSAQRTRCGHHVTARISCEEEPAER